MSTVIKVENLSKQYRLGDVGTGSIAHDVNRAWHKIRGKEDPYLKIGETNDRTKKGDSDYVWAIKDINFEVKQGEVLGIIGRNGAGKSTLLKILSRTTTPTTGSVKIKGRVASLLEVGTGFHPELSGRENIFLNGAIMGMTKQEIKTKFDEIVDFSGVERYIDTPVKRYSSGMYVRLAFGVAAHLEPEILIVDEVLAVGDAEFQKKALGKMKDVSDKDGRTVLFVSHNMIAMRQLCEKGILMDKGRVDRYDSMQNILSYYHLKDIVNLKRLSINSFRNYDITKSPVVIQDIFIDKQSEVITELSMNMDFVIIITIKVIQPIKNASVSIDIINSEYINVGIAFSWDTNFYLNIEKPGIYEIHYRISKHQLTPGDYFISTGVNQSDKTHAWDGITCYPFLKVINNNNILYYTHRSWGINHFNGNEWTLIKK